MCFQLRPRNESISFRWIVEVPFRIGVEYIFALCLTLSVVLQIELRKRMEDEKEIESIHPMSSSMQDEKVELCE